MDFSFTQVQIGFCSALVTELLKLIPALKTNELAKAITAIVVTTLGVFIFGGAHSWKDIIPALLYAFVSYKTVIQPVASSAGSPTQR